MDRDAWRRRLAQTLTDRRLTRGEKRALSALLEEQALSVAERDRLRAEAFALAADELDGPGARAVLEWLREVTALLARVGGAPPSVPARSAAWFTPADDAVHRIEGLLRATKSSLDLCVFTITDNRLSDAIGAAHGRGVRVRIVTDDEKRHDEGSDIARLARAGVPVVTDRSEHHMHHKFALFDRALLLTGSYNWTRSAAHGNRENLCLTGDPRLVRAYLREFGRLWRAYRGNGAGS